MKTLFLKTIALGALAIASAASHGAVLTYGNFTGTDPDSSETVGTYTGVGSFAIGFTANNTTTYTLTSASFDISRDGNRLLRFRLYSGNLPGNSGVLIAGTTITGVTPAGTSGVTTFSGLNVNLVSGTTYWMVVDANGTTANATASGSIFAHSEAGTDTATMSNGGTSLSFIGGRTSTTSDNMSTANSSAFASTAVPNFSVTVPEPHEYAMVAGLGLCAFAAYRRRAQRVIA